MALSSHKYAYGKQGQGLGIICTQVQGSAYGISQHSVTLACNCLLHSMVVRRCAWLRHSNFLHCLVLLSGLLCTFLKSVLDNRDSNLNWAAHQPCAGKFPVAPTIRHPVYIWCGDSAHTGGSFLQLNTECCRETAESGRWCTCLCITGIRRGTKEFCFPC